MNMTDFQIDSMLTAAERDEPARLLVVDDEEKIRRALATILSDEGWTVRECPDGRQAADLAGREPFDVVIADIRMPAVGGLELLEMLSASHPSLPVILISGHADMKAAVDALQKQAFDFMLKPFDPEELLRAVRKALSFRRLAEVEKEYRGVLEHTVARSALELRKYMEELRAARDEALAASEAKSVFIATMSHEIRTPLNGIIGVADLLLAKPHGPEQAEYLRLVKEAAERLHILLSDVLSYSRLSSGSIRLLDELFPLRESLATTVSLFTARAADKGLRFGCRIADDVPNPIVGDSIRLEQVLTNLLDNAIKFTDTGSVDLSVMPESVAADETAADVLIRFEVKDTGIGIPRDQQESVFESFRQGDSSLVRRHGGCGLGLAIARQIVQAMGGAIKVKSTPGAGSTFSFSIPFKRGGQTS